MAGGIASGRLVGVFIVLIAHGGSALFPSPCVPSKGLRTEELKQEQPIEETIEQKLHARRVQQRLLRGRTLPFGKGARCGWRQHRATS